MLLLIFEVHPESLIFYILPTDHPQAENIRRSDSLLINSDDIPEVHPIWALNEWLATDEASQFIVDTPYKGTITEVYQCGLVL
jgi:hypothetical protein